MRTRIVLAAALLLAGCATVSHPPPMTREDVVQMAKAGEPPVAIIRRLQETGTVFALNASDLVRLHEQLQATTIAIALMPVTAVGVHILKIALLLVIERGSAIRHGVTDECV